MYICIARIRKTPLAHCKQNANKANRLVFRLRRTAALRRSSGRQALYIQCRTKGGKKSYNEGDAADGSHVIISNVK